ncbi:MAG: helix-turn-helix domain-containing protein [Rhodothermales bacterium]
MERTRLIALHQDGLYSVTELAERFGVSRPTIYTWLARYQEGGAAALADRSSARHSQHAQTAPAVEALIVECRKAHPTWGPRKLLPYLAKRHPDVTLPAPSTAGAILKRHSLTKPRRKRRPPKHPGSSPLTVTAPNQVWTTDFKGQFKTRDGLYCYPLTVCDAHSRFVLGCHALPSVKQKGTFLVFERLFGEYGLPDAIRSDNGVPFALPFLGREGRRSAVSLGYRSGGSSSASATRGAPMVRIEPGQPQQNGRHPPHRGGVGACTERSRQTPLVLQSSP